MTRIESPHRPRRFTWLTVAGAILIVLLALLGRSHGTVGLGVLYLASVLGTVAIEAVAGDTGSSGKT